MVEGLFISACGAVLGIITGHVGAYAIVTMIQTLHGLIVPETLLTFNVNDLYLIGLGAVLGIGAGLIPAWMAAKTDIAYLLSKGRI